MTYRKGDFVILRTLATRYTVALVISARRDGSVPTRLDTSTGERVLDATRGQRFSADAVLPIVRDELNGARIAFDALTVGGAVYTWSSVQDLRRDFVRSQWLRPANFTYADRFEFRGYCVGFRSVHVDRLVCRRLLNVASGQDALALARLYNLADGYQLVSLYPRASLNIRRIRD